MDSSDSTFKCVKLITEYAIGYWEDQDVRMILVPPSLDVSVNLVLYTLIRVSVGVGNQLRPVFQLLPCGDPHEVERRTGHSTQCEAYWTLVRTTPARRS